MLESSVLELVQNAMKCGCRHKTYAINTMFGSEGLFIYFHSNILLVRDATTKKESEYSQRTFYITLNVGQYGYDLERGTTVTYRRWGLFAGTHPVRARWVRTVSNRRLRARVKPTHARSLLRCTAVQLRPRISWELTSIAGYV